MFGWLKKKIEPKEVEINWVEYKGFRVASTPIAEGGQYRVSGVIEKGEEPVRRHSFVRADLIPGEAEANDISMMKAKLMVDQLGDGVFDD